jgi:hypothetical protein
VVELLIHGNELLSVGGRKFLEEVKVTVSSTRRIIFLAFG